MKKILMILLTCLAFIGSANTDSLTDTDKAAQKALAEKYVQALQNKDMNAVNQLIDYDIYADNMLRNLSAKNKKGNNSLLTTAKVRFVLGQKNYQKIYSHNKNITLMDWVDVPNFSGYIVRFINSDYVSFYLGLVPKKINQQWKIVDFYDPVKQDRISHFVANSMNKMAFNKDRAITKIDKGKHVLFAEKIKQRQYAQAIKIYRSFSDDVKREEAVIDLGLGITDHFSNDEKFYDELIEIVGTYNRDNPKYYSRLLDYYILKKEYGKAKEGIKNFFASVSDTAMMNFQLAGISVMEKDYSSAFKEVKQCIKAEPHLLACYEMWINVADTMKNYDEEVLAYQATSKKLGMNFTKSMFNEKEDGDFVHSDAFKNWDIPDN